jgi:hypothetical protein
MIIVSYGMQKSASTFVYQLIRDMLENAGHNQENIRNKFLFKENSAPYQNLTGEYLEYFCSVVPENQIYLIKTHSHLDNLMKEMLFNKKALALATYRDPLDIVISLLDVGKSEKLLPILQQRQPFADINTVSDAINMLDWIIPSAESWLECDYVKPISYVDIYLQPYNVAEEIKRLLNLDVNAKIICEKYISNKMAIGEFNKGGIGRWKGVISDAELFVIQKKYKDFMGKWL